MGDISAFGNICQHVLLERKGSLLSIWCGYKEQLAKATMYFDDDVVRWKAFISEKKMEAGQLREG